MPTYPLRFLSKPLLLPWVHVVAGLVLLQLLTVIAVGVLLFVVPQAQEALFALAATLDDRSAPAAPGVTAFPFTSMILAGIALSMMVWYTARLMVTVDAGKTRPVAFAEAAYAPAVEQASTSVPRLLGTLCALLLVAAFLVSLRDPGARRGHATLLAFLVPLPLLFAGTLAIRVRGLHPFIALGLVAAGLLGTGAALAFADLASARAGLVASLVPAGVMAFFVGRRRLLRWVQGRPRAGRAAAHVPGADAEVPFAASVWKLVFWFAASFALLVLLNGPTGLVRAIGSPAVILLFLVGFLGLATTGLLLLRHWTAGITGAVAAAVLVAVLVAPVSTVLFGWAPFAETYGRESLPPVPYAKVIGRPCETLRDGAPQHVIVNSYGGGIRAAVFTALVLAEMDDRTAGAFGRCLHALSGVSGGSVGIAVYLALREQYEAAGYWGPCKAGAPTLRSWAESVLVQDHLSPVVGRLLTRDLLPFLNPARGQALLDSWQGAMVATLGDARSTCGTINAAGLAMPVAQLTGAILPPPNVYFNATDVLTGERLWLSNKELWRTQFHLTELPGIDAVAPSLGEAILHSARFPLVTPAGRFPPQGPLTRLLVDGGYAENSGAETLFENVASARPYLWLNIDGNPIEDDPQSLALDQSTPGYTGFGALLNVRTSQAANAIRRARSKHAQGESPEQNCPVTVIFDLVLDRGERCGTLVRRKNADPARAAPLGWFMSRQTLQDREEAVRDAVDRVCRDFPCAAKVAGR